MLSQNLGRSMIDLRKLGYVFLSVLVVGCSIPIITKSLPWVREKESYRSVFSRAVFQAKMQKDSPDWMLKQIDYDFQDFNDKIPLKTVEATFQTICERVGATTFYHYRIVDRVLYKYVPLGSHFSNTDTPLEKALKTLLLYAQVPDVDFILCPMDGLPEPYMPSTFFIMDSKNQAPILAKAKLKETKYVVLIPDQFSLSNDWLVDVREIQEANHVAWKNKKEIAVWRGGLTDIGQPNGNGHTVLQYQAYPRFIISKQSIQFPALVDAGITWFDPEMHSILKSEGVIKGAFSITEHLRYKYLPVLDGHMCTYPGYQWRLLSNSVCFKQESNQIQWFYSALQPYVHYVPIRNDIGDLVEKIQWARMHDRKVKQISKQARDFALHNLMFEDDYVYLYLVLKKYASLEEMDGRQLKKEMKDDPHWKCIQYRKRLDLQKSWTRFIQFFGQ